MQRRHFLTTLGAAPFLSLAGASARAQIADMHEAINSAGRQRMLSQRMAKFWMALAHDVEVPLSKQLLERSVALFERQLTELKAYAPNATISGTYAQLDSAWAEYKTLLTGAAPHKSAAIAVLQADARVLALSHQGTVQYEATLARPVGQLVNMAGRQRMLSQRMAKFYLAAMLPVEPATAQQEMTKARTEFIAAMDVLRTAPEATPAIKEELQLADGQWLFFDAAMKRTQLNGSQQPLRDMLITSENLLSSMDHLTGLYTALKA